MLRIMRDKNKYTVECYNYNTVDNINTLVYSWSELSLPDTVHFLKGRVSAYTEEDIYAAFTSHRPPTQVLISDTGVLKASVV